jgi:hypothetical protein
VFLFPFVVVLRGRRVVACGELCVYVVGDGQTRFLALLALFAFEIAHHVLSDSRLLVFYEAVSVGITRVLSATVRAVRATGSRRVCLRYVKASCLPQPSRLWGIFFGSQAPMLTSANPPPFVPVHLLGDRPVRKQSCIIITPILPLRVGVIIFHRQTLGVLMRTDIG